eukprot:CAMPEP_0197316882 /NCGR_PEP_ID=MMETSP0891-20130614/44668_1 /TAXON_ID=44058 ORGANISM="Aureoumbra lagunensis, Strain CCMP1510" /NCGR_SAMPLE_ID=MMETSP0891 /ASSEMBLY_ACC=CAM_ASM_000534 /LENGTH=310 /DNA_ID=CAMNT_0042806577 /DNA_START=193 /DNA_END=1125 /DNA_ORIENTATION=-
MSTVGFGDVVPLSVLGKIVTTASMLFGVVFLSMPLAIVGNNFCLVWEDKERVIFVEKLREQLRFQKRQFKALIETFEMMDADGSNLISFREFRQALKRINVRISRSHLKKLWRTLDYGASGEVELTEFLMLVFKDDHIALDAALHRFGDTFLGDDDDQDNNSSVEMTSQSNPNPNPPQSTSIITSNITTETLEHALNSLQHFRTGLQGEPKKNITTTKIETMHTSPTYSPYKKGTSFLPPLAQGQLSPQNSSTLGPKSLPFSHFPTNSLTKQDTATASDTVASSSFIEQHTATSSFIAKDNGGSGHDCQK